MLYTVDVFDLCGIPERGMYNIDFLTVWDYTTPSRCHRKQANSLDQSGLQLKTPNIPRIPTMYKLFQCRRS